MEKFRTYICVGGMPQAIDAYINAKDYIVNIARNISEPEVELTTSVDYSDVKMFMGDTGLLVTKAIGDNKEYGNDLYKRIIFDKDSSNLGSIYENVAAQILKAKNYDLLFNTYLYVDKNLKSDKAKKYEVDFIIKNNKHVIPIEVKSSAFKNHKSLDNLYKKFKKKRDKSIIVYTKNYKVEDGITYIPIYMLPFEFLSL